MSGGSSTNWLASVGEHPLLRRRPVLAHATAAMLVAAAVALRLALGDLLIGVPYITFYSMVAISAFIGGWSAGASATLLSVVGAVLFLLPPAYGFKLATLSDALGLAGFALTCGLMVLLTHIAVRAAEASAQLARQRQVLLME